MRPGYFDWLRQQTKFDPASRSDQLVRNRPKPSVFDNPAEFDRNADITVCECGEGQNVLYFVGNVTPARLTGPHHVSQVSLIVHRIVVDPRIPLVQIVRDRNWEAVAKLGNGIPKTGPLRPEDMAAVERDRANLERQAKELEKRMEDELRRNPGYEARQEIKLRYEREIAKLMFSYLLERGVIRYGGFFDTDQIYDRLREQRDAEHAKWEAIANQRFEDEEKRRLFLSLVNTALDIGGIFEPTPFCDFAGALVGVANDDPLGAGINVVSGLAPYAGDSLKGLKIPKYLATLAAIVVISAKDAEFAKYARPLIVRMINLLRQCADLPGPWKQVLEVLEKSLKEIDDVAPDVAASTARVLQRGGHTMRPGTAKALNAATGRDLHAREWGRALERLKKREGLGNDHHGQIDELGNYLDEFGRIIGNLEDYLQ